MVTGKKYIRRINIYGGAGCGKSTMAAKLFAELKSRKHDVVLVNEYIKPRAYRGDFPKSHEQLYVFAKQEHAEDELLPFVTAVISDSPLLMNAAYSKKYGFRGCEEIIALAKQFEEDYPGLHFFLTRKYPYVQDGRYQTESESIEIDGWIQGLMELHLPQDRTFYDDMSFDFMIRVIEEHLPCPHAS